MTVRLLETPHVVRVDSPYDPEFVTRARQLGGKCDRPTGQWVFDIEAAELVRQTCLELYGSDGSPVETVDIQVTARALLDVGPDAGGVTTARLAGRPLVQAWDFDKGARTAEGVLVVSGSIETAGTHDEPRVRIPEGTVLSVREMPVPALDTVDPDQWEVEIVPRDLDAEIAALEGRREAVLAQIEAIEGRLEDLYARRREALEEGAAAAEAHDGPEPDM